MPTQKRALCVLVRDAQVCCKGLSKEYQFKKDQYDGLDALAKNESVSKLLLIKDFPSLDCKDHEGFVSKLILTNSKSQVYGSESYNALATIQNDIGNS